MKIVFAVIAGLVLSVGLAVTIEPASTGEICHLQEIRLDQLGELVWMTLEQMYFENGGISP